MASPVEIIFEGGGSLIDDLKTLAKASADLSVVHRKAHDGIQDDLQKSAEEAKALGKDMDAASKTVVVLGKEATKTAKATGDAVAASRKQAAQIIADNEKLTEAQKKQAAAAGGITKEYEDIAVAASKAKAQQVAAFEQPIGLLDQIQARLELLGQKKLSLTDEDAIARANDEIERLQLQYDGINNATTSTVNGTKELRARIKEALDQAVRARAAFGDLSPEFKAAADEAARLQKELKDTQDRVKALNPGDKVAAFSQLGNAIAGGAQAISGFAIALGGNNQALQETLFKFQSVLFAVQGAQSFLRDFSDSIANVRAVLGLTTVAQVENTVATEADVLAKQGQVVANAAATTSTNVFTTAVRGLTAAMLANPIGLFVAAIAVIGATFYELATFTEEATFNLDRFLDRLDRLSKRDVADINFDKRVDLLRSERNAIAEAETIEGRRAKLARDRRIEEEAIRKEQAAADRAQVEATEAIAILRREQAELGFDQERAEAIEKTLEREEEYTNRSIELGRELQVAQQQTANAFAEFDRDAKKEALERAKELARLRLQITEDLASQLEAAEKEIQQRIAGLAEAEADPVRKVELQRQAAQQEVALLERKLLRIAALEKERARLGDEAFNQLSERQKQARADALIDAGAVALSVQQTKALNELKLAEEDAYLQAISDAYAENTKVRLDLIADTREKERAEFELGLADRIDALRKAQATEEQLREFVRQERERFDRESAIKSLEAEEEIRIAEVQSRTADGEIVKAFERRKQQDILDIRIEAAQRRLKLLENDNTEEGRVVRAQTQALIADLTQQSEALKRTPLDINLLDLLGIAPEDQQRVKDALGQVFGATLLIISAGIAARQQEVQAAIRATDEIIGDAQRRRQELQGELDRALQDQREGYANNADAIRDQIEQTKAAEREALEEKKRQILEQRKLARQQVLLDAAGQTSALSLSVANLIKTWSTIPFGVGLISAFAQAASIYAFMAQTRLRLKQASQGPQFRHGGRLKDSLLVGPSHEGGGIALLDRRTGHYYGEAEGGEGIVRRSSMAKRGDMVDAINKDDFARIQRHARQELERTGHMVLSRKQLARMRSQTESFGSAQAGSSGLGAILLELVSLREELASFKRQEGQRERVDGNERRLPQHKTITR